MTKIKGHILNFLKREEWELLSHSKEPYPLNKDIALEKCLDDPNNEYEFLFNSENELEHIRIITNYDDFERTWNFYIKVKGTFKEPQTVNAPLGMLQLNGKDVTLEDCIISNEFGIPMNQEKALEDALNLEGVFYAYLFTSSDDVKSIEIRNPKHTLRYDYKIEFKEGVKIE